MANKLPVPESEKKVLENLIRDLSETYPDKVIVRLQQDHKNWSEKVTRLYKNIGYASRDEFLAAYGFTVEKPNGGKRGRPATDLNAIVEELVSRYEGDKTVANMDQLKEENPDLAPKFKSIQNKAKDLFGMSFVNYLKKKGVIRSAKKAEEDKKKEYQERLDVMLAELKSRYEGKKLPETIQELKNSNADIDNIYNIGPWIARVYTRKPIDYLIELGLVQKKEKKPVIIETKSKRSKQEADEEKLENMISLIMERYDGKNPETSGDEFRLNKNNSDISYYSLDNLCRKIYKMTAYQYLIGQGIIIPLGLREELERNHTHVSDIVLKITPDSSVTEYHILTDAFPKDVTFGLIEQCKRFETRLVYESGDDELVIDCVNVEPEALQVIADTYRDKIPVAMIRVISSWKSDDRTLFVNWACDAIQRKKERPVLIRLLKSKLVEKEIVNEIAVNFLDHTSPKGINKKDTENFTEVCIAAADFLDLKMLKSRYSDKISLAPLISLVESMQETFLKNTAIENGYQALFASENHEAKLERAMKLFTSCVKEIEQKMDKTNDYVFPFVSDTFIKGPAFDALVEPEFAFDFFDSAFKWMKENSMNYDADIDPRDIKKEYQNSFNDILRFEKLLLDGGLGVRYPVGLAVAFIIYVNPTSKIEIEFVRDKREWRGDYRKSKCVCLEISDYGFDTTVHYNYYDAYRM